MMEKMKDKITAKIKNIMNMEFLSNNPIHAANFSFYDLSLLPIGIVFMGFRHFIQNAVIYGLLISILAFATGQSYVCNFGFENKYFSCSHTIDIYVTFFLFRLLIVAVFLRNWYKAAICGEKISFKNMLTITFQDWKVLIYILIVLLFLILPFISVIILSYRDPNPNWIIESMFFAFVSIGMWLPFVALRFCGLFSYAFNDKKCPSFKTIWQYTSGNMLKIIMSTFIVCVFNILLFFYFNSLIDKIIEYDTTISVIISEFLYNILFLLMVLIFSGISFVHGEALSHWDIKEQTSKVD